MAAIAVAAMPTLTHRRVSKVTERISYPPSQLARTEYDKCLVRQVTGSCELSQLSCELTTRCGHSATLFNALFGFEPSR
jgi:hypothetical protein